MMGENGRVLDFPSRLRLAIGDKSARSFAIKCEISPAALHQYLTGKSEPTRPALIAMANEANISLKWLATGEGPMRGDESGVIISKKATEEDHEPSSKAASDLPFLGVQEFDPDVLEILEILYEEEPDMRKFVLQLLRSRRDYKEALKGLAVKRETGGEGCL